MVKREELELVIQKKKIQEVFNWFEEHFVKSSHEQYRQRCPFLIVQGPVGCGKTTTLKCVARELRIPIREYSETTDTTAINYEINHAHEEFEESNLSRTIDRRKAAKFEHFVITNIRFKPLYPAQPNEGPQLASADSEFESDDDDAFTVATMSKGPRPPRPPSGGGVVIHVESLLPFARSQNVFIQSINKLVKAIKDISRSTTRRVAIVFENLDADKEVRSLPTKFKTSLGVQTIKFNPIIRQNMKRFLENRLAEHKNLVIDKETVELIVSDCAGDIGACLNSIELLRNGSQNFNSVFMGLDNNELKQFRGALQVNKRQKLNPGLERVKMNSTLMRDITKSLGFFHLLGKIFYQKRYYPERTLQRRFRSIDRPYKPENSVDSLVDRLIVTPADLLTWLHQHYHKFCQDSNIDKASLFLSHLAEVDNISMNSTQSTQFYETHAVVDQLQLHLAVEATMFSLYEDQSEVVKSSHKKVNKDDGLYFVKPSVENSNLNGTADLYSFNRPTSLIVPKVAEDHQKLLDYFTSESLTRHGVRIDGTSALTDYIPYMYHMFKCRANLDDCFISDCNRKSKLLRDDNIEKIVRTLVDSEQTAELDFEKRHERLQEAIDEIYTETEKVGVKERIYKI